MIPFFSITVELWRLVEVRSEGGLGLDCWVTRVFSVMALGHCYSESSCNAEAWPVAGLPGDHMRGCSFSLRTRSLPGAPAEGLVANNQRSFVAVLTALHKH